MGSIAAQMNGAPVKAYFVVRLQRMRQMLRYVVGRVMVRSN